MISSHDVRFVDWEYWLTSSGSVHREKATKSVFPGTPSSRGERNKRTFDAANLSPEPSPKIRKKQTKEPAEDKEYVPDFQIPPPPLFLSPLRPQTPVSNRQTIDYSPLKQIALDKKDNALISLFLPRTVRDPTDGTYWTIVRVLRALKPSLDLEDSKIVSLKLVNCPPSEQELNEFPEKLQKTLRLYDNVTLLDEELSSQEVEYKIHPPDEDIIFERKIHRAGKPNHHVAIQWITIGGREGKKVNLFDDEY